MALLEVACFNAQSAIIADEAGADRIELCRDQSAGGVTPPVEWLSQVKDKVKVPVFVMIRARGGNFNFSEAEFEEMKADLDRLKTAADGFVLGILDQKHQIDMTRTAELVQRAHPLPCTFHRAFDETSDPLAALEDVISTGCQAVLTSGGAANAIAGIDTLQRLVERAKGRIVIMPGGGVRLQNLCQLQTVTGATMFHTSGMLKGADLPSAAEIRQMRQQVHQRTPGQPVASGPDLRSPSQELSPGAVSVGVTPIEERENIL